jgi:hypothetical protein
MQSELFATPYPDDRTTKKGNTRDTGPPDRPPGPRQARRSSGESGTNGFDPEKSGFDPEKSGFDPEKSGFDPSWRMASIR